MIPINKQYRVRTFSGTISVTTGEGQSTEVVALGAAMDGHHIVGAICNCKIEADAVQGIIPNPVLSGAINSVSIPVGGNFLSDPVGIVVESVPSANADYVELVAALSEYSSVDVAFTYVLYVVYSQNSQQTLPKPWGQ